MRYSFITPAPRHPRAIAERHLDAALALLDQPHVAAAVTAVEKNGVETLKTIAREWRDFEANSSKMRQNFKWATHLQEQISAANTEGKTAEDVHQGMPITEFSLHLTAFLDYAAQKGAATHASGPSAR